MYKSRFESTDRGGESIMRTREYSENIESILSKYSNLRALIPKGWPSCITQEQVQTYNKQRNEKYWEHINLPALAFTLSKLNNDDDKNTIRLYESILELLEWFSKNMVKLPGGKLTLKPLWTNTWSTKDNSFWSVISEVSLTKLLVDRGWEIIGFNRKITSYSNVDADIRAMRNGKLAHIEVEALSLTKVIEGNNEKFRNLIVTRTKKKIDKKFEHLPDKEVGIVAIIFRPQNSNMERFSYKSSSTDPIITVRANVSGKVYWLAGGNKHGQEYSILLVDNTLVTEPYDSPTKDSH
ncbi:MAG: hypothetical protein V1773_10740 [bacterium]